MLGRSGRREAVCSVGIVARRRRATPKNARDAARNSRCPLASGMTPCLSPCVAPMRLVGGTTTVMAAPLGRPATLVAPEAGVAAPAMIAMTVTGGPVAPTARPAMTSTMSERTPPARHAARAPARHPAADAPPTMTSVAGVTPPAMALPGARMGCQTTAPGVGIGLGATKSRSRRAIPTIRSPFLRSPMTASRRSL